MLRRSPNKDGGNGVARSRKIAKIRSCRDEDPNGIIHRARDLDSVSLAGKAICVVDQLFCAVWNCSDRHRPLELIPDRWHRLNFLVNALATGFFFVSIMFAIVAISFALSLSTSERSIFCLAGWATLLIVYHFAIPRLKRSPFHRLSQDRGMYSSPTDDDKRN